MKENTLQEICRKLELPEVVIKEMKILETVLDTEKINCLLPGLANPEEWGKCRQEIKEVLGDDKNGMKMLCCMLQAASFSYEKYQEQRISEKIFLDTMKCFTRFVMEHKASFGTYGFDRDFWTGRQLSLQLFRLGELEYEKKRNNGKPEISMHIPSDAVLEQASCRQSLACAAAFFRKQDTEFDNVPYRCCSWLLSPALQKLLPEDSRIIQFQRMFQIEEVVKEADEFLEWVFKRKDIPIANLPEDTTLQRNMKAHLLHGGWVGEGIGTLSGR